MLFISESMKYANGGEHNQLASINEYDPDYYYDGDYVDSYYSDEYVKDTSEGLNESTDRSAQGGRLLQQHEGGGRLDDSSDGVHSDATENLMSSVVSSDNGIGDSVRPALHQKQGPDDDSLLTSSERSGINARNRRGSTSSARMNRKRISVGSHLSMNVVSNGRASSRVGSVKNVGVGRRLVRSVVPGQRSPSSISSHRPRMAASQGQLQLPSGVTPLPIKLSAATVTWYKNDSEITSRRHIITSAGHLNITKVGTSELILTPLYRLL